MGKRENLDQWQARLDQRAEDFCLEAGLLKKQGNLSQLRGQATQFMAHIFESPEVESERTHENQRMKAAQDLAFFSD
jgi:hypothetical protein